MYFISIRIKSDEKHNYCFFFFQIERQDFAWISIRKMEIRWKLFRQIKEKNVALTVIIMIACCVVWFIRFVAEDKRRHFGKSLGADKANGILLLFFFLRFFILWFGAKRAIIKLNLLKSTNEARFIYSRMQGMFDCVGHVTFKVRALFMDYSISRRYINVWPHVISPLFSEHCIVDSFFFLHRLYLHATIEKKMW